MRIKLIMVAILNKVIDCRYFSPYKRFMISSAKMKQNIDNG